MRHYKMEVYNNASDYCEECPYYYADEYSLEANECNRCPNYKNNNAEVYEDDNDNI